MDYPHYDPQSPLTPLTPAELQALDTLLQGLADEGAMSLDGLDGYLTALVVGPPALLASLATADWLPLVWGGDGAGGSADATPFVSKRQRKATVVLVLRHLRHIAHQFAAAPQDWEPIFSIAEHGAQEWVDARDWCTGFLQAVDLDAAAWGGVWSDVDLSTVLAPLLALGGGLAGAVDGIPDPGDDAACDALSRSVPDAVLALREQFGSAAGAAGD